MNDDILHDYYGTLGVRKTATVSEIHKAYWHQAALCHPDKGGSHDDMVLLVEAWKILSDPVKRARYDQLRKSSQDGWQSRRFNEDVREARNRAKAAAGSSWTEFEAVYQKAFYAFNQDFYGEDLDRRAAGPYSPLMNSENDTGIGKYAAKIRQAGNASNSTGSTLIVNVFKALVLLIVMLAVFLAYRHFWGIGMFVPLGSQDASTLFILDTSTGAVYSTENRSGLLSLSWKEAVPPVPRENRRLFR
jgi:hypothetical protein